MFLKKYLLKEISSGTKNNRLEQVLLSVVSDLTGYPTEMLGLDMDIESDLGIDSIKRVEILSSLEEKMPGLPHVSPEHMGRLKTLGQVLEHLESVRDMETSDRNIASATSKISRNLKKITQPTSSFPLSAS
jgi:acyl carrier protein